MLAVMPAVVVGLAAVAGLYPLSPRLMLCVLPGWLFCIAVEVDHGLGWLATRMRRGRLEPVVRAVAFCCLALMFGVRGLIEFGQQSEAGTLTAWARSGSDPLYVFVRGLPQFLFYSTDWHSPDTARAAFLHGLSRAGAPFFENGESPPPAPATLLRPVWTAGDSLLLGTPDGLFIRAGFGWNASSVGPEWLSNEASRIGDAGRKAVSLLVLHNIDAGGTNLLRTLEQESWACQPLIARGGDFAARCLRADDAASTPAR
jgi:hypothetical protein